MQDKRIIVACILVVICFIIIGVIGNGISGSRPEETTSATITTETATTV